MNINPLANIRRLIYELHSSDVIPPASRYLQSRGFTHNSAYRSLDKNIGNIVIRVIMPRMTNTDFEVIVYDNKLKSEVSKLKVKNLPQLKSYIEGLERKHA